MEDKDKVADFQRAVRDAQARKLQRDIDAQMKQLLRERTLKHELELERAAYKRRHDRVLWGAVVMLTMGLAIAGVLGLLK